jgi:acyl-CoA thioesterase FadM
MREDEYTVVEDVVGPGDPNSDYHLLVWQTQQLTELLWSSYLATANKGNDNGDVVVAPRRVTIMVETESYPGQLLKRGIRTVSRTRRSFTLEAAVWDAKDDHLICTTEIVTVCVDRSSAKAVEPPPALWAGIERLEGRTIAITERTPA